MNRRDFVSLSRLLVAAGYAVQTLVVRQTLDFELTALGQTRLRELFSHLASLPEPGSPGRVEAILNVAVEMKHLSTSPDEIEALVAVCLHFCKTQHKSP
jgi:hypothetical protein